MVFPMLMTHSQLSLFMFIVWVVLVALIGLMLCDAYLTHKETEKTIEERRQQRERKQERRHLQVAIIAEQIGFWAWGWTTSRESIRLPKPRWGG